MKYLQLFKSNGVTKCLLFYNVCLVFKVKIPVVINFVYFRMEELEVQDLDFLHGCPNPTIILIHQDLNGRHVKTHEISLKDKEFVKVKF